jgi:hypothetical protein
MSGFVCAENVVVRIGFDSAENSRSGAESEGMATGGFVRAEK